MWSIHSQRCSGVWDSYFSPLKAANIGIGGDKVENILWRVEDLELPSSLTHLFLHCGTNNLSRSSPRDIADEILSIGVMAKKKLANLMIIVGGLLHCDILPTRSNVGEVNTILRQKVKKLDAFYFMEQDCDWVKDDESKSLNMEYFVKDGIHLNYQGNKKIANTIIRKLKDIESLSPSSSGIILRIPSCEAPQKVVSRASSVLSPFPVVCPSSQPSSRPLLSHRRPLYTKVPKDVYDHHERLLALSSSCVSSPHRRPPQNRRLSPCSTSCHRSQGDDSGCVASPSSWSFLSFVIMVLATILLPVTTLSCHFASFICSLSCHISSFCLRHSHLRPFRSQPHSSQPRHTPQSSPSNKSYSYCSSFQSHLIRIPSYTQLIYVFFLFIYAFFLLNLLTLAPLTTFD